MITTRRFGGTRHLHALAAALSTVLALSACAAGSPQPLSTDVIATRVDSMAQAYMARKGPARMSIDISCGHDTLFQRAYGSSARSGILACAAHRAQRSTTKGETD